MTPPPIGPNDALFIDFDGTLTEIAPTPDAVRVDARAPDLMTRWSRRLDGALAVISGRPLVQLIPLLRPYRGAMAGVYGLERRLPGGKIITSAPLPELLHARRAMASFAAQFPGVALEDKGSSFSVHYRARPDSADALQEAAQAAAGSRLVAAPGKMVVEVLPKGYDKGMAIEAFMAEPPFRGRRPIFVGDDRQDEAGFAAVNRVGGESIVVGTPAGPTAARHRLDDVGAVLAWLEEQLSADAAGASHAKAS